LARESQAAGELPDAPWPRTHRRIVPRPAARASASEISDAAAGILYLEPATLVNGETRTSTVVRPPVTEARRRT
jgi:hypothetical protein